MNYKGLDEGNYIDFELTNVLIDSFNEFVKSKEDLIKHIRKFSSVPLGIQISHAGRKGSSHIPWKKFNSSFNNISSQKLNTQCPIIFFRIVILEEDINESRYSGSDYDTSKTTKLDESNF